MLFSEGEVTYRMPESTPHMPVKTEPYAHQKAAFAFACKLFGLQGGDAPLSISSRGIALLMEM